MDQSIRLRRPDELEQDDASPENRRPMNYAFISSSPDAIRTDLGDRCFSVIDLTREE